jgi:hypothetical protein
MPDISCTRDVATKAPHATGRMCESEQLHTAYRMPYRMAYARDGENSACDSLACLSRARLEVDLAAAC